MVSHINRSCALWHLNKIIVDAYPHLEPGHRGDPVKVTCLGSSLAFGYLLWLIQLLAWIRSLRSSTPSRSTAQVVDGLVVGQGTLRIPPRERPECTTAGMIEHITSFKPACTVPVARCLLSILTVLMLYADNTRRGMVMMLRDPRHRVSSAFHYYKHADGTTHRGVMSC